MSILKKLELVLGIGFFSCVAISFAWNDIIALLNAPYALSAHQHLKLGVDIIWIGIWFAAIAATLLLVFNKNPYKTNQLKRST